MNRMSAEDFELLLSDCDIKVAEKRVATFVVATLASMAASCESMASSFRASVELQAQHNQWSQRMTDQAEEDLNLRRKSHDQDYRLQEEPAGIPLFQHPCIFADHAFANTAVCALCGRQVGDPQIYFHYFQCGPSRAICVCRDRQYCREDFAYRFANAEALPEMLEEYDAIFQPGTTLSITNVRGYVLVVRQSAARCGLIGTESRKART